MTTALVYAIFLLLDDFDDENTDDDESERSSRSIEEGYGFLTHLASTSKFASVAVSSLDERLFSSEDDVELRCAQSSGPATFGLDTPYGDGTGQGAILAEDISAARNTLPVAEMMETEKGCSLLNDLETGYGELDTISLGRI